MGETVGYFTQDFLQSKYPLPEIPFSYLINGAVLPDDGLLSDIGSLNENEGLFHNNTFIAAKTSDPDIGKLSKVEWINQPIEVKYPWDIFKLNAEEIREDYHKILLNNESREMNDQHTVIYGSDIFIGDNVDIKAAVLNAENGPIFIGNDVSIEENSVIHGPVAICDEAVVKLGSKLRQNTSIGPGSRVGGEISNTVILANSNKSHEGYLGSSVIGEWCNIGADSNTSNLKNNYSNIKLWDYEQESIFQSDLQFCGLIMGDHSKCGINTMFNSGTVVGFCASVFGAGFPPKHIPSFTWGGIEEISTYEVEKGMETAKLVMARRNQSLTNEDISIFHAIMEATTSHRFWERDK